MNWIILIFASVFEVSMTFCLGKTKTAEGPSFWWWIAAFVISAIISMGLLAKATQHLPIGTAYAVWTGLGALGTVLIGIFVFHEPATFLRLLFICTLFCSIVGLKIVS
ncbi:MAG: multidrug efflux SMR transporter [Bacteroidales bacterium]|nr:multidrug efflux SMR transporter [Bacteroidales bacterium]MDD4670787.1 multidrug efflux SMR transporter [Bacteroidales bacterium]